LIFNQTSEKDFINFQSLKGVSVMKKSNFHFLGICLAVFLVVGSTSAYAVTISYVNNSPSIASQYFQMIDPSWYYNSGFEGGAKAAGNSLDNARVYLWDNTGFFQMMKWDAGAPVDALIVYPDIEHGNTQGDLLQWSLWGSNAPAEDPSAWTLLWDPTAASGSNANDITAIAANGAAISATIYRQTNPGIGTIVGDGFGDSFTIVFTLSESYQYFGIRSSTLDPGKDPEINAVAAAVPEPGILILLGISMASIVGLRRWWKE
jgi:hypothetical protein